QMIVGPSFVITSAPDTIQAICQRLCDRFDADIGLHYDYKDRRNGYITIQGEDGSVRQLPLMSLSIGILTSDDGPFYDIRELSESVEEVRQRALTEAREQGRKSHMSIGRA
ncbi:MAG: response regulator, partial [Roseiflexus sp.]|nr:response regulator [Roseiflexus sp.]